MLGCSRPVWPQTDFTGGDLLQALSERYQTGPRRPSPRNGLPPEIDTLAQGSGFAGPDRLVLYSLGTGDHWCPRIIERTNDGDPDEIPETPTALS